MKHFLKYVLLMLLLLVSTGCVLLAEPESPLLSELEGPAHMTVSLVTHQSPVGGGPLPGIGGVLDIHSDGNCVRLVSDTQSYLVVWPEPTYWDAANLAIEFIQIVTKEQRMLKHGDRLTVGGSWWTFDDRYIEPPYSACEVDRILMLQGVNRNKDNDCASSYGYSQVQKSPRDDC